MPGCAGTRKLSRCCAGSPPAPGGDLGKLPDFTLDIIAAILLPVPKRQGFLGFENFFEKSVFH
jgi:hypothetical protein